MRGGGALLLAWLFCVGVMGSQRATDCQCRLPDSIIPQHYDLEIIPHLENNIFIFEGRVSIKVHCLQATKQIILHLNDLIIEENSIKLRDLNTNATIQIDKFEISVVKEFLIIYSAEELVVNHDYLLFIPFTGVLKNSLDGFYRSSYIDYNTKEQKWIAVTQFEPTDARRAFPCFDEPAMKAIFKIHLGRLQNYTSISNMPIAATEPMNGKPGWFWDHYEESVPLSTYLVAFAVTDFEHVSSSTKDGTTFRVWARHSAIRQVEFAKTTGPKCLEYFEGYFNISYPLPKQDMVAIPDFSAGAMENWGLITYREGELLYDVDSSSASHKTSIAAVISHELAHQWFGNLVTMKWWTDLWLNEGFATYMANVAVEYMFPQWNFFTHETINNLFSVFVKDSLKTSHPVSVPVGNPKEINEIFDIISYDKGSYLLHMMANFLGKETFRKGVSNYLKEHKYNNAEQDDLWKALTFQAHQDKALPTNLTVKTIMDTWTLETGYPVVTVTRDYQNNTATFKQERYLRDIIRLERSSETCWWIPITYTTEEKPDFNIRRPENWLSCPQEYNSIINDLPSNDKWVIFNIQAAGLYRVNYDENNWKLLIAVLNSDLHHKIPPINKALLIDDSANLAWIEKLTYDIHFNILTYLKLERGYLPWRAAFSNLNNLNKLLKRHAIYGTFKQYVKQLLTPIYSQIGGFKLPEDSDDNLEIIKHQVQVTAWGCRFEVGGCTEEARKLFSEWLEKPEKNSIPKDLRSIVYCNAIKLGGENEWNFLWKQYLASNSATEKNTILNALGCTEEIWLLQRYLEWAIDIGSGIRLQDSADVIQVVANNNVGFYVAKTFLYSSIKNINQRFSSSSKRLARVITALASQMTTTSDYAELKAFTDTNQKYLLANKQAVEQGLETATLNIQWHAKHYHEVKKLLQELVK